MQSRSTEICKRCWETLGREQWPWLGTTRHCTVVSPALPGWGPAAPCGAQEQPAPSQGPTVWGWHGRTHPQCARGAAWCACPCWCLSRVPAVAGVDTQLEHPHLHRRVCMWGTHTFQYLQNPHCLWGAGCAHLVCVCRLVTESCLEICRCLLTFCCV